MNIPFSAIIRGMNIKWDSNSYKDNFSFVPSYGIDVMNLITKEPGSTALDLGCGNGRLTSELKKRGFRVSGLDQSKEMLSLARRDYPDITFMEDDAVSFSLREKVDLIFSNAVLHWIDEDKQPSLIENISSNLNEGGELVLEMGGVGCAEAVHSTLERIFKEKGLGYRRIFYFPSIGEYTSIIDSHGLKTDYAILFDRPTVQKSSDGLIEWIKMFDNSPFEGLDEDVKEEIYEEARIRLKERLYHDDSWVIDYVRLRIRAHKV